MACCLVNFAPSQIAISSLVSLINKISLNLLSFASGKTISKVSS